MHRGRVPSAPCPRAAHLFLDPGEQWEEELWGNVVPARPFPLEGLRREGALGGTEMQDRLHILEDLNMLYIRQMALSLEVMTPTPTPRAPLWQASQPQFLPCPTLLGLSGEGRPAQSGRGTGGSVCPALGAVWIRLSIANQSVLLTRGSCLHTDLWKLCGWV